MMSTGLIQGRRPCFVLKMLGAVGLACTLLGSHAAAQTILQGSPILLTPSSTAAASASQDVRPLPVQRGTTLDGTMRKMAGIAISPANQFYADPAPSASIGGFSLLTGAYSPTVVDWQGSSRGRVGWVIGRSYNQVQSTGSSNHVSNGAQGKNWFQLSQPEIRILSGAGTSGLDVIEIVYGADRFLQFQRTGSSATTYQGVNGAGGIIEAVAGSSGEPDTYIYHEPNGMLVYFFGGNTSSNRANYQLWKIVAPDGHIAFVGDATTASTAASTGYDANKNIQVAYDGTGTDATDGGRRYTYNYTASIGGRIRLESVIVQVRGETEWTDAIEIARVEYTYYADDTALGSAGQLATVSVSERMSDSTEQTRTTRYTYYKGEYVNNVNADSGNRGNVGDLKFVFEPEGVRRFENSAAYQSNGWSSVPSVLVGYSAAYFQYPSTDHRPDRAIFNGECGCSGGGANGEHLFTYSTNGSYSDASPAAYDQEWKSRTVVTRPDGTYETVDFDEAGQVLTRATTAGQPGSGGQGATWVTLFERDAEGMVHAVVSPSAVDTWTFSTGGATKFSAVGLVTRYGRVTASVAQKGFVSSMSLVNGDGSSGSSTGPLQFDLEYTTSASRAITTTPLVTLVRPLVSTSRSYSGYITSTGGSSGFDTTTYAYTAHATSGTSPLRLSLKQIATTLPTVSTGKNGPNAAVTTTTYHLQDGSLAFNSDATYAGPEQVDRVTYHQVNRRGQLVATVLDVSSPSSSFSPSALTAAITDTDVSLAPENTGLNIITSAEYDEQGRETGLMAYSVGCVQQSTYTYYTTLEDGLTPEAGRRVAVRFSRRSGNLLYGPASLWVINHAGKAEATMLLAIPDAGLDISDLQELIVEDASTIQGIVEQNPAGHSTPTDAQKVFIKRLDESIYSNAGHQLIESRTYYDITGNDYDTTEYAYDGMGRIDTVTDSTGTIDESTYDTIGRLISRAVGTSSGNMTTIESMEYDSASPGGNGHLTKRTLHSDSVSDEPREYTYIYDYRGRKIVAKSPVVSSVNYGVHTVNSYDNRNRVLATAGYSSASGLSASTNPASNATDRLTLSESLYDEQGRTYKAIGHKIDQTDGSSDDTIDSLTWYDPSGRVIKTRGSQIIKTEYDRLGRVTRTFTIAKDNDTSYGDIFDAETDGTWAVKTDGDTVVKETRSYLDSCTGLPLMQVHVSRAHNASVTGALISGTDFEEVPAADSPPTSRTDITAMWYDSLNRVVATASYGNNSGSAFDRDSVTSVPSSSSSVLVSSVVYDGDGTVLEVTDPKGIKARTLKDDTGRTLASIANYVDGTPGGMSGTTAIENDEDHITRYEYTNGQITKMIADRPSGFTDQETVYTYGVTKGTGTNQSSISSNRLLYTVLYPQGSYTDAGDRLVTYAYNAQGQRRRVLDQAGNAITTTYDRAGREVSRGIGVVTGYIDDVKRIEMTYNPRGMVNTVTQYDASTAGNALDEVRYEYDEWGNLKNFDQDVDSTFAGSSGGRWGVAYAYSKAAPTGAGQNLRRTSQTLPGGASIAYGYGTSGGVDDSLSRVAKISIGTTDLAEYQYLGVSQLVGTHLPEAGQKYNAYPNGGTASEYDNLDAYGRVIRSEWEKTGAGAPAYAVQIAYDYNSDITRVQDQLHSLEQMSALYTMDNLNRVVAADQGKLVESSGSYTVDDDWRWRKETWTLSQTGNWLAHSIGTNSAANNALVETGTFNTANEWTARSRTVPATASDTPVYDKVGNMVNDGKGLAYKYDGLGRLREVRLTGESNRLKTAYRYNGLGMRITHAINMSVGSSDDDVTDSGDAVTYFAYDERWRVAGVWVSDANTTPSSSTPTERWIHHAAGMGGRGGSSYIDSVVLRDRDVVISGGTANSTSDGGTDPLEERIYVLQNWRADVVATVGRTGILIEWMQYTAYGSAITNPPGNADFNGDGSVTGDDVIAFYLAHSAGLLSADINNDGGVDGTDIEEFDSIYAAGDFPRPGVSFNTAIRIGYAGYQWDGSVNVGRDYTGAPAGLYHVRHRVYDSEMGRWTRRDPIGYVDGMGLYEYVRSRPVSMRDPSGLTGEFVQRHIKNRQSLLGSGHLQRPDLGGKAVIVTRAIIGNELLYNDSPEIVDVLISNHNIWHEGIMLADGTVWAYQRGGFMEKEAEYPGTLEIEAYDIVQPNSPMAYMGGLIAHNSPSRNTTFDDSLMRQALYNIAITNKYRSDNYNTYTRNCQQCVDDVLREYDRLRRDNIIPVSIMVNMYWLTGNPRWLECQCYGYGTACTDGFGRPCVI